MKITVNQLRKIIREEVEHEKLRSVIKEAVRQEMINEGFLDTIADFGTMVKNKLVGYSAKDKKMLQNLAHGVERLASIQKEYKDGDQKAKLSIEKSLSDAGLNKKLATDNMALEYLVNVLKKQKAGNYDKQDFKGFLSTLTANISKEDLLKLHDLDYGKMHSDLGQARSETDAEKRKAKRDQEESERARAGREHDKMMRARTDAAEEDERLRRIRGTGADTDYYRREKIKDPDSDRGEDLRYTKGYGA